MKKLLALFFSICAFSQLMCDGINWSTPVFISTIGDSVSDPHVVIDANANVTAVWVDNGFIVASSQPANGSWSAPTTLSNTGASMPKLGIDSTGNVTALWLESGVVKSSSLPLNGSWSAETSLSGATGTASAPVLAVDSSGNAVAVWVQTSILSVVSIQSATQLINGSWQAIPDTISGSTSSPSSPSVAIGSNGTVMAVWHSLSASNDLINSNSKTLIGGIWGTPLNFFQGTATYHHNYPKVVLDANGNATAIWLRYNLSSSVYNNINVLTSTLPLNASAWSIPAALSGNGETLNIANISTCLSVDTDGDAIAAWCMSYDGSTYYVESSSKMYAGSWNQSVALQGGVLYAFQASLAANNSLGATLFAYMMYDGVSSVVITANETNVAASRQVWKFPVVLSQGSENGYPHVAVSINGQTVNAAAVWKNSDGVNTTIVASTGSKMTISPPTNLAVVQSSTSYGLFTDYYNTITWSPSPSSNITRYNIYRNGVYFTVVNPYDVQVIDHNAFQSGSITYGITAESDGAVSPMAQINFP